MRAASCIYGFTVAARRRMMSNWRTMTHCTRFDARRFAVLLAGAVLMLGARHPGWAASPGILGRPAPDFALPAVAGSNVRLSEYRGQPVILSFWSSRCSTCAKQLAALDKLYGTYRSSGLVIFGVSVDDNLLHAQEYARRHSASYPLLLDREKSVGRSFLIDRLPTTLLIDRAGVVRYIHGDDPADERSYVVQIRTLLDDRPAVP
jgi:peroxiredoxin